MPGVPWTKFQDFYLRLGFIKTLVVTLSPFRRSESNETIYRRLESPLFKPATSCPALADITRHLVESYGDEDKADGRPYVLEALLAGDDCPSWLFAVTRKTIYKILDWGHDIRFVGAGNQITERGLMLRNLLPSNSEDFLTGDGSEWNPFVLSTLERIFFMFHLSEIDRPTLLLINLLAEKNENDVLESSDAGKLTCKALFSVLNEAKATLSPRFLPQFRVAHELASVIAQELGLKEYLPDNSHGLPQVRRLPKPLKALKRGGTALQGGGMRKKPNKNADHQTIPRFEQLVDLGFLRKSGIEGEHAVTPPQKRWRYRPTHLCKLWRDAKQVSNDPARNWLWHGFAKTVVESITLDVKKQSPPTFSNLIDFFSDAYETVHRPIGHTPLESVALYGMLRAAGEGYAIEMADFHQFMLEIKKKNLLPDHAFFASGNDVDTMFINLRKGYRDKLLEIQPNISKGVTDVPSRPKSDE
jgi:hypothetical protein